MRVFFKRLPDYVGDSAFVLAACSWLLQVSRWFISGTPVVQAFPESDFYRHSGRSETEIRNLKVKQLSSTNATDKWDSGFRRCRPRNDGPV